MFARLQPYLDAARAWIASVPYSLARALTRAAAPAGWMCVGFVTVGAVAAAAAYLPFHADRSGIAPKAARSEASGWQERSSSFVQRWHDKWKQIDLSGGSAARGPHDVSWLWGDATLSPHATRFVPNDVRVPGSIVATRLPLARPDDIDRAAAAAASPQVTEPRLASLPPQSEPSQPKPDASEPGLLDKLFGDPDRAAKAVLAAHPNKALYDITKRVLYLPDGTKLEAHSGFGEWMDDPESMHRKNVGVTPPNVYALSFREKPFHGVRALRMKPVGEGNMYGRDGILAHSFLLGEAGASNGCISVREYEKFLKAYEDGLFNQIIVLRSIDEPVPRLLASAQ